MPDVLRCRDIPHARLASLLARYDLALERVADGAPIPGSYWGDEEAGIIERRVYVRGDTPIHSLLHEAGHTICMAEDRRRGLDTDASSDEAEENGVCYLQILLADTIEGVGAARLMDDMDRWGYSFRLGSTRAWFEDDAEDARAWLVEHGLLDDCGPVWRLRS